MGALDQQQVGVRHRLTADQVQRMVRTGVLDSSARVELIDGELFDMAPIGHPHGFFCQAIAAQLIDLVGARRVLVQMSLTLGENDTVQPDICVLSSAEAHHLVTGPELAAVQLVIEISDTSLAYDLNKKLPRYSAAGVPELWVLDVTAKRLLLHREPEGARYAVVRELKPSAHVRPTLLPDFELDLAALFAGR